MNAALYLILRVSEEGCYERKRNATHRVPTTDTYVDYTNKATEDDKYPWLYTDDM